MNPARVLAILSKDARDALRDGRILIALLLPIALAVFYNATTPDEDELPRATAVVTDSALADRLERAAGRSVDLEVISARDGAAARRAVDDDDADLAVVTEGQRVDVLVPENADTAARTVAALVPAAQAAVDVRLQTLQVDPSTQEPAELLEQREIVVVTFVVLFVGFVALLVVPITIAEELETGTFGALRLAATGPEILLAKVLNGLMFGIAGIVVTVLITGLSPHDPVLFVLAGLVLTVSVIGFGLLLGLVSGNANQINTFGGLLLFPVIALAVMVLVVDGGVLQVVLDVLPFSQATRLMFDATSSEQLFGSPGVSWLVVGVWAVGGYALLARYVSRREA